MAKVFDYIKRSKELMEDGVPLEDAVKILNKEKSEADEFVFNDGLWDSELAKLREEAMAEAEEELQKQK